MVLLHPVYTAMDFLLCAKSLICPDRPWILIMTNLEKLWGKHFWAPTRIYVKALNALKDGGVKIKACSHITGGGFYENVPRMLPEGVHAVIHKNSYEVPAIFKLLAQRGDIEEKMMYNTFNMGIGMIIGVDAACANEAVKLLEAAVRLPM